MLGRIARRELRVVRLPAYRRICQSDLEVRPRDFDRVQGRAVALGVAARRDGRDDDQGEELHLWLAGALAPKPELTDLVGDLVVGEDGALEVAVTLLGELAAKVSAGGVCDDWSGHEHGGAGADFFEGEQV